MTDVPRATLDEKLVALALALRSANIPYAFGGAIALAYSGEPRGTIDLDVNVFVPEAEAERVFDALAPLGVRIERSAARRRVASEGQVRLDWAGTPVDLFFAYDAFHDACRARVRRVQFADTPIAVLSAEDLVVFKVLFARRKDWADVEQVLRSRGKRFDLDYTRKWLRRALLARDSRLAEFEAIVAETRAR